MKNILFLEVSLQALHEKTLKEFPTRLEKAVNIADDIITESIVFHYNPTSRTLLALVRVIGSDPSPYITTMLFDKIKEDDIEGVPIISGKKDFNIEKINDTNNCKVRCTCKDFMWTFNYYNKKEKSLRGSVREPYTKKTSRPPRNPGETPGLCKHLLALYIKLEHIGLV